VKKKVRKDNVEEATIVTDLPPDKQMAHSMRYSEDSSKAASRLIKEINMGLSKT